mmetsp:Transcript_8957/g.22045  ORF Transcript_8957/g.22045 Transcript_8957/m.22045 type:complete len:227 (+) Transcript_8957:397-1077(+)
MLQVGRRHPLLFRRRNRGRLLRTLCRVIGLGALAEVFKHREDLVHDLGRFFGPIPQDPRPSGGFGRGQGCGCGRGCGCGCGGGGGGEGGGRGAGASTGQSEHGVGARIELFKGLEARAGISRVKLCARALERLPQLEDQADLLIAYNLSPLLRVHQGVADVHVRLLNAPTLPRGDDPRKEEANKRGSWEIVPGLLVLVILASTLADKFVEDRIRRIHFGQEELEEL